jgi:hypothetical protein
MREAVFDPFLSIQCRYLYYREEEEGYRRTVFWYFYDYGVCCDSYVLI